MVLLINTVFSITSLQLRREFRAVTNIHDGVAGLVEEWVTKMQKKLLEYVEKEASSSASLTTKMAGVEGMFEKVILFLVASKVC